MLAYIGLIIVDYKCIRSGLASLYAQDNVIKFVAVVACVRQEACIAANPLSTRMQQERTIQHHSAVVDATDGTCFALLNCVSCALLCFQDIYLHIN